MYDTLDLVDEMQWEDSEMGFTILEGGWPRITRMGHGPRANFVYYFSEEM